MKFHPRHLCAVLGVAVAVATVVFMQSLVATNDHQATAVVERLLADVPVAEGTHVARLALDYRPDGRVLQGPPMMVCANDGAEDLPDGSCRVTRALFAQRAFDPPAVGGELVVVGEKGVYRLTVAEVLDWDRPVRGYPNLFVNAATAKTIDETWDRWRPVVVDELAPSLRSDAGRDLDRAKLLLLWAAALTALCLLVNTLFLSVESRRREIAILRTLGLTRGGVVRAVFGESVLLALVGTAVGVGVGALGLLGYVACDRALFPLGGAFATRAIAVCVVLAPILAGLAALCALRAALGVRPLEAASLHPPRRRRRGMVISFAFGFGAFVAVEVWGSSLMHVFVPSPEWPDAIVSILPGGVSSFDIEKLRDLEGVKQLAELQPLQVNFSPLEKMENPRATEGRGPRGRAAYRNALLLASDWLPAFRFVAGERDEAVEALRTSDACVITEMMARGRKLGLGDAVTLDCGRGFVMELPIVGIVDLNWHMVTSRGLVRGLNRMPVNTDGPVFVGFKTIEACDARPSSLVRMTHLWLDFDDDFEREYGAFEAGRRVEAQITAALGGAKGNTVQLHSRDEIADGTFAHGDDLIGSAARVPFIFIAVLSLGFIAMLVASVESRKQEFRVLRAIGATRLQVAFVLVREACTTAVRGMVYGLVFGALVGWLFTFATRRMMANWGLPPAFAVPWTTIALGALGALGFALAVAVPTAMILCRCRKK